MEPLSLSLPGPIVVLGGGGFIGSNLARRLVDDGRDDVIAFDIDFPEFRMKASPWVHRETCDLTHKLAAQTDMRGAGTVFHLAADMGGVGYFHSDADLGASLRNGRMTLNVLETAAEFGVQRLFYASSACAYPIEYQMVAGRATPMDEDWLGMGTPDALYGAEKLHGARLCSKVPGARVGILHTVFGPLQEHEGRRMKFPAAVATKAIRSARTGQPLELWGDGRQLRSYCYIDDAIEQIITVAASDVYEGPVNVGESGAISCRDVAEICLAHVGAESVGIVTNPAEPSGVLARDASMVKYSRLYGGRASRTYADGFGSFIDWLETVL